MQKKRTSVSDLLHEYRSCESRLSKAQRRADFYLLEIKWHDEEKFKYTSLKKIDHATKDGCRGEQRAKVEPLLVQSVQKSENSDEPEAPENLLVLAAREKIEKDPEGKEVRSRYMAERKKLFKEVRNLNKLIPAIAALDKDAELGEIDRNIRKRGGDTTARKATQNRALCIVAALLITNRPTKKSLFLLSEVKRLYALEPEERDRSNVIRDILAQANTREEELKRRLNKRGKLKASRLATQVSVELLGLKPSRKKPYVRSVYNHFLKLENNM